MTAIRRRLRAFVWIALVAMGGLALGPSISRALGIGAADAQAGNAQHEHHHHAHAGNPLSTGSSDPQAPAHHSHSLDHCELCAVAAAAYTIAPTLPTLVVASANVAPVIVSSEVPQHPRDLWPAASPRGPPRSS